VRPSSLNRDELPLVKHSSSAIWSLTKASPSSRANIVWAECKISCTPTWATQRCMSPSTAVVESNAGNDRIPLRFGRRLGKIFTKIHCRQLFLQVVENSNNSLFALADTTATAYLWTHLALYRNSMFIFLPWSDQIRSFIRVNMSLKYAKRLRFGWILAIPILQEDHSYVPLEMLWFVLAVRRIGLKLCQPWEPADFCVEK